MSKRFTDTTKWEDDWFLNLTPPQKLFWIYICDRCDAAGVWRVSQKAAEALIGQTIDLKECLLAFGDRIKVLDGDYWHISKFCAFQYGKFDTKNSAHRGAIKLLKLRGLEAPSTEGQGGVDPLKDKDKDTVKEKEESNRVSLREYTDYFSEKYLKQYGKKIVSIQGHWIALQNFVKENEIELSEFKARVDNYFDDPYITSHNQLGLLSKWQDMVQKRMTLDGKKEAEIRAAKLAKWKKDLR